MRYRLELVVFTLMLASCSTAPISVERLSLDQTSLSMEVGSTVALNATVYPEDASDYKLVWTSSSDKVDVDSKGLVKAVLPGNAVVTVSVDGTQVKATCNVTVKEPDMLAIDRTDASMTALGEKTVINITSNINWTVSADSDWLMFSPKQGAGNGKITVWGEQNISGSSRVAALTIQGIPGTQVESFKIKFTQDAGFAQSIGTDNWTYDGEY